MVEYFGHKSIYFYDVMKCAKKIKFNMRVSFKKCFQIINAVVKISLLHINLSSIFIFADYMISTVPDKYVNFCTRLRCSFFFLKIHIYRMIDNCLEEYITTFVFGVYHLTGELFTLKELYTIGK